MNKINHLILSDSKDFTTDYIAIEFNKRNINYLRIDRDLLPDINVSWDINNNDLFIYKNDNEYIINENSLKSVYYRAPTYLRETFSRNLTVEDQLKSSQWMSFYRNLLVFNNAKWMNSPSATFYAENKMVQLNIANKIGFNIPKTLLTNSTKNLDSMNNNLIIKSLDTAVFNYGDKEGFVYTNEISKYELQTSELSLAPVIVQQNLINKIDLRVTVIGNTVYPVEILLNNVGIDGDWRKQKDHVRFKHTSLPTSINNLCIRIVKELGLNFGAIDLILYKNEYYFVEINPTGEWAWLVDAANLNIYEAICNNLLNL